MGLSLDQVRQFHEQGYLLIQRMFSAEEVQAMRERVEDWLEKRRPYPRQWAMMEPAVASGSVQVAHREKGYRKLATVTLVDPVFCRLTTQEKFASVLQACIGPNVTAWGSGIFLKQVKSGSRQPWHRDEHGYGGPAATIWTPLTDATVENGCMQLAPGSHRHEPCRSNKQEEQRYQQDEFDWPVDVIPMKAGDSIIWNMSTLHSSDPNRSDKSRWALAVHCVTTEAAIRTRKAHPHSGPNHIVAGQHDPETAQAAGCMHCDQRAFAKFVPEQTAYKG